MLEQELRTYDREVERLARESRGQFVLIKGDDVIGVYPDRDAALESGYTRFGLDCFLVKRIEVAETIHHFSRTVDHCHT